MNMIRKEKQKRKKFNNYSINNNIFLKPANDIEVDKIHQKIWVEIVKSIR